MRRTRGAVAAGPFDAGQGDGPEPAQPAGQAGVSGQGGRELLDAERPPRRVPLAHRIVGFALFALTVPIAVHCLIAYGVQLTSLRVAVHSLAGCFFTVPSWLRSCWCRAGGCPAGRCRLPGAPSPSSSGCSGTPPRSGTTTATGSPARSACAAPGVDVFARLPAETGPAGQRMAQSRTAYGGGRLSSCRVDSVMRIAPGIHRIGGHSMINAYLVEQAGEVTIIDAGLPGYYGDIDRELAAMGRAAADVRALVLTHGHSDHSASRSGCGASGQSRCRFTRPTPRWRVARCRTRRRASARSNSGRSLAFCGSRCCTAGFAPPGCSRFPHQPSSPSRSLVSADLVASLPGTQPPAPTGRGRRSRLRDLLHPGPRPHAAPFIATSRPLARQSSPPRYASSTRTFTTASPMAATGVAARRTPKAQRSTRTKNGPNSRQV